MPPCCKPHLLEVFLVLHERRLPCLPAHVCQRHAHGRIGACLELAAGEDVKPAETMIGAFWGQFCFLIYRTWHLLHQSRDRQSLLKCSHYSLLSENSLRSVVA